MMRINQKIKGLIITCVIGIITFSCASPKDVNNKTESQKTEGSKQIISAPIIVKDKVLRHGVISDEKELYIQQSIQDYYIKFCESAVSRKELEKYLETKSADIKVTKLEVEIIDGDWDICDDNLNSQSRTGKYMIIHRIITN